MSLIQSYIAKKYLKLVLVVTFASIAVLFVSQLKEIAEFAAMGASIQSIARFISLQIPFFLSIALPVASLVASILVFQYLSHSQELTALRASGLSLRKILSPLLLTSLVLSFANFYNTSELTARSKVNLRQILHQYSSVNPLLLLQSAKIASLKSAFVQMKPIKNGRTAEDLLIAFKTDAQERLNLIIAKEVEVKGESIKLKHVSFVANPTAKGSSLNSLAIENQKEMTTDASASARFLRDKGWKVSNDYLPLSLLSAKKKLLKINPSKKSIKEYAKCNTEIARRLCMGLAPLTFGLMGAGFGIEISRNQSRKRMFIAILLAATTLCAFFVGNQFTSLPLVAATLFFLPHGLILYASFLSFNRVKRGIE